MQVFSSTSVSESDALAVTSGTKEIEEVLDNNNLEVIYDFIEFREVTNDTNLSTVEELDYIYDTNLKDQLSEYEGYEYTYDEIGNPVSIIKDSVTYRTFTWTKGRQLASMYVYVESGNDLDIYYKYNDNGIRTEKKIVERVTLDETITTYKVSGSKIIEETSSSDTIHYIYDAESRLVAFKLNDSTYYYKRDITGSILGILDDSGDEIVSYTYDTWGSIISTTDTSGISLSIKNPYRYKGYYHDGETDYYYLNSRYYNPEIKRFINADSILGYQGNILSTNMYTYTNNNPVNYIDSSGYFPKWAKVALIGVAAIVVTVAVVMAAPAVATMAGLVAVSISSSVALYTAATTVALIGVGVVAGATLEFGLSRAIEEATDYNPIRDDLMSGNQDAYDTAEGIVSVAAFGIITVGVTSPKRADCTSNPLDGTTYKRKVIDQMENDIYHGFPSAIDNMATYNDVTFKAGVDGVIRMFVEFPGNINGVDGIYQYIIEPDGMINHRFFDVFK